MNDSEQEKRTILIVDGSASSIFYTASMLRKLRYTVRTASTGESALEMIAHSAPSVVITEAVLPKMSGLNLLEQMKNNRSLRFIPVIIITDDKRNETREACRKAGCAGYFIKPTEPEQIYRAIQTASEATPRRHIRIETSLKARIETGPGGGETTIEEVTTLSEGGLYIKTSAPMPVNTVVPLTLIVGNCEVKMRAVVLYSSEKAGGLHAVPGMGIKFTNVSDADLSVIRKFIKESVVRDLQARKDQK